MLATFRDVEPADALRRALPELLRAGAVERLDLRRFDLDDVRAQLTDPTEAQRVLDVTGGNPLFVREVARAIADGMWRPDRPPATVRDVVAARLERVSEPCRTLVRAAAVVGRDFPLGLVAATLDVPVVDCLPAVDEAVAWGLVEELGTDYRFCHALTRDAVAASLTTAERAALHRRVAEAIAARNADDLAEHLPDLARHWAELAPFGEADGAGGGPSRPRRTPSAGSPTRRACGSTAARWPWRSPGGRRRSGAACSSRWAGPRCCPATSRGGVEATREAARWADTRSSPPRPRSCWRPCRTRASTPWPRSCARRRWPGSATTAPPGCGPGCSPSAATWRSTTASRSGSRSSPRPRSRRPARRATTTRWSARCAPGRRRGPGRPAGRNGSRWAPRWSRSRRGWTARARRCGGGSGGSRR